MLKLVNIYFKCHNQGVNWEIDLKHLTLPDGHAGAMIAKYSQGTLSRCDLCYVLAPFAVKNKSNWVTVTQN